MEKLKVGKYRWRIVALLFFATTINYIDRQVLGLLKSTLETTFGWNDIDYSNMVVAFQAAYALGYLFMGWFLDKVGVRIGFSIAIVVWSIAAIFHSAVRSIGGFMIARFALGLGEAGNFPACVKTVAQWFPKKERSFATGVFNSGTNVGAILAPAVVAFIIVRMSWEWAFIITGALGFIWLVFWLFIYKAPENHPHLSQEEYDYIKSDPTEPVEKIPWIKIISKKQTIAFAVGKFLTDPIWWIYLFWLPDFFKKNYGLEISTATATLPLVIIYLISDVGSIAGGWLSTNLIKRGWSFNKARKTTMLICAIAVTPIIFASQTHNIWMAIGLISLATAAHQGWSANLFTLTSDMFPQKAVGSVVGIGGMIGAIGGMFIAKAVGFILEFTKSYMAVFMIAGTSYLIALLIIHLLVPRLEPAKLT